MKTPCLATLPVDRAIESSNRHSKAKCYVFQGPLILTSSIKTFTYQSTPAGTAKQAVQDTADHNRCFVPTTQLTLKFNFHCKDCLCDHRRIILSYSECQQLALGLITLQEFINSIFDPKLTLYHLCGVYSTSTPGPQSLGPCFLPTYLLTERLFLSVPTTNVPNAGSLWKSVFMILLASQSHTHMARPTRSGGQGLEDQTEAEDRFKQDLACGLCRAGDMNWGEIQAELRGECRHRFA